MSDTIVELVMHLQCVDEMDHTTVINSDELTRQVQVRALAKHGLTMLMMYRATGEERYLKQARNDYDRTKSLRGGFQRPLGVHLKEAA